MASTIDKIKNDIIEAMNASQKRTSAYDTEAEIVRVDGDTAWVHIAGGVSETPVALTINARKGDKVQIRVTNGGAWIMGNVTAPPTDDAKAVSAEKKAIVADENAANAITSATIAKEAADEATEYASIAANSASQAQSLSEIAYNSAQIASQSATEAVESANQAVTGARQVNVYAREALSSLSSIEDVVDVLGWISEHGSYVLTTDTSVDINKAYYVNTGEGYRLEPVPTSTYIEDMYEQTSTSSYQITTDREIIEGKTYYIYDSVNDTYIVVTNPVEDDLSIYYEYITIISYESTEDASPVSGKTYYAYDATNGVYTAETPTSTIGTYYEIQLDESVRNYIMTHIALTDEGLSVVKDDNAYYILIASDGVYIKNETGGTVASYGSTIILGDEANEVRNIITSTRISFRTNAGDVAYFGLNNNDVWEMHVSVAGIEDMLMFGDYAWIKRNNGNMSLKWVGQ